MARAATLYSQTTKKSQFVSILFFFLPRHENQTWMWRGILNQIWEIYIRKYTRVVFGVVIRIETARCQSQNLIRRIDFFFFFFQTQFKSISTYGTRYKTWRNGLNRPSRLNSHLRDWSPASCRRLPLSRSDESNQKLKIRRRKCILFIGFIYSISFISLLPTDGMIITTEEIWSWPVPQ